jgi:hypothetical protein
MANMSVENVEDVRRALTARVTKECPRCNGKLFSVGSSFYFLPSMQETFGPTGREVDTGSGRVLVAHICDHCGFTGLHEVQALGISPPGRR